MATAWAVTEADEQAVKARASTSRSGVERNSGGVCDLIADRQPAAELTRASDALARNSYDRRIDIDALCREPLMRLTGPASP